MPKVRITSKMSEAQVRKLVRQAMENLDPQKELEELREELRQFEQQFGMSSEEFIAKYEQGKMGDSAEVIRWAGEYRMYLRLSEKGAQKAKAAA